MAERRYSEAEMAEIFRRATEEVVRRGEGGALTLREEGFTLDQIQEIGAEAGIPVEEIQRSALSLGAIAGVPDMQRFMGAPVGVNHAVDLPRRLSDDEFRDLVSLLRDTFYAEGQIEEGSGYRRWTNGNLSFSLEARGEGERIRMRTRKSEGEALPVVGMALTGFAGFLSIILLGSPEKAGKIVPLIASFLASGGLIFSVGQWRLRTWAMNRLEQMREIGHRLGIVTSQPLAIEAPGAGDPVDGSDGIGDEG